MKNYFRVLEVKSSLNCELENKSDADNKQKISNLKAVTLIFTSELMSIDSENPLFKVINSGRHISNLIKRSHFDKRRRKLFLFKERYKKKMASRFLHFEDYFVVNSITLDIYKFERHIRIKSCEN